MRSRRTIVGPKKYLIILRSAFTPAISALRSALVEASSLSMSALMATTSALMGNDIGLGGNRILESPGHGGNNGFGVSFVDTDGLEVSAGFQRIENGCGHGVLSWLEPNTTSQRPQVSSSGDALGTLLNNWNKLDWRFCNPLAMKVLEWFAW